MTCAGRSRARSLARPVSARTCRTRSSGKVLAITPRLTWSLRRTPAGRPAGARAIVAARPRTSASMAQLSSFGDDGARLGTALLVEGRHGVVDGSIEIIGAAEGPVGEVVALQVAPGALDVVQLGRVPRQPLDGEPRPGGERPPARLAGVDRAVVEHQHHRPVR